MREDKIRFLCAGQEITSWTDVSITKSIEKFNSEFSLTVGRGVYNNTKEFKIYPYDKCEIYYGNDRILTGFVIKTNPKLTKSSHTITITGKDITCLLVDSSVTGDLSFQNTTAKTLSSKLIKNFGLYNVIAKDDFKIESFKVNPGDSYFETLTLIARRNSFSLHSDYMGTLSFTPFTVVSAEPITERTSFLMEPDVSLDYAERFSHYIVRSQSACDDKWYDDTLGTKSNTNLSATIVDKDFSRKVYKPKVILANDVESIDSLKKIAEWEKLTRASKSVTLSMKKSLWRQSNGKLWDLWQESAISLPSMDINRPMTVKSLTYGFNSNGTSLALNFTEKDAFLPEAYRPKKTKDTLPDWVSDSYEKIRK